jgi:transcriptional regulator with GAF, ATPase, and Fis domain
MPTVRWFPRQGPPRAFAIYKPVTTIGRALGNDIAIEGPGVAEHHAQIYWDNRDFNLEEIDRSADITIGTPPKKKRRARLVHGDRFALGEAELSFSIFSDGTGTAPTYGDDGERSDTDPTARDLGGELGGVRKLHDFSEKLMSQAKGEIDALLHQMLDAIVDITGAERGILLLVEDGKAVVRAARDIKKETITDPSGQVSDSIVRRVLETRRPLIVSDALADTNFGKSESVVAMSLSSVMCVPLMAQGELLGVLYVGSQRVKGLFEKQSLDLLTIFAGQASLILENAMLLNSLRADKDMLVKELGDKKFGDIIGASPFMMEVFKKLQKVATTDISVLITGETGTGKELIAREIHRRSQRATGPFISINCGAIPENLIESELFGHVKGAFTGAIASRPGKFQAAQGGTLFLDEIGELPVNLQVKLVRALQERVVNRVGDARPEKVDIRVVAATNRLLEEEIKKGAFREDLYYRLNVVNIFLPPLRERGDDVLIIAKALLSKYADEMHSKVVGYAPATLAAVRKYPWPGNIRQLENRIKKALVMCDKALLQPEDLDLGPDAQASILPLEKAKEEFQRKYVLEALERNNGNRTQTARDLGVDPRTIFRYLEAERGATPPGGSGEGESQS